MRRPDVTGSGLRAERRDEVKPLADRCDAIVRLIDDALAHIGPVSPASADVGRRGPERLGPPGDRHVGPTLGGRRREGAERRRPCDVAP